MGIPVTTTTTKQPPVVFAATMKPAPPSASLRQLGTLVLVATLCTYALLTAERRLIDGYYHHRDGLRWNRPPDHRQPGQHQGGAAVRSAAPCTIAECAPPPMPSRDVVLSASNLQASDVSMTAFAWSGSPILVDRQHLVYCPIPKNACSLMKRFVKLLSGHSNWDSRNGDHVHDPGQNGLTYIRDVGLARANEILHDPSWTRLVVVRDPIERFASGFLDKCHAPDGAVNVTLNSNCPAANVEGAGSPEHVLTQLERQLAADGPTALNDHFRPQSQFCDLRKYARSYVTVAMEDFRPAMHAFIRATSPSRAVANANLAAFEQVAGAHVVKAHSTPSAELAAAWVAEADECARLNPTQGNGTSPSSTAATVAACDNLIAVRLRKLYADDYRLLGLTQRHAQKVDYA